MSGAKHGGLAMRAALAAATACALAGPAAAQGSVSAPTSATGSILQPIVVTKVRDLSFGTVTRPQSGGTLFTIDATTGARTASGGNGSVLTGGSPGRAELTITGEGGQAYQVTAPSTLTLTSQAGGQTLTINLTTTAKTGSLTGGIGTTASTTFGVGGSVTLYPQTVSGTYSGAFEITVAYN